jgi:hypothetical protein
MVEPPLNQIRTCRSRSNLQPQVAIELVILGVIRVIRMVQSGGTSFIRLHFRSQQDSAMAKASIQTFNEVAGESGGKGADNILGSASGFGL